MDYGKVLSRAWEITWRWKMLWILGFLAVLGRGLSSGSNMTYSTSSSDWGSSYGDPFILPRIAGLLIALCCLGLIIGIALWVISVIARGGLIAGVQHVEEEGSTSFGQAWRVGVSRFWTLFGIGVLAVLPLLVMFLLGMIVTIVAIAGAVTATSLSEGAIAVELLLAITCSGVLCCGLIILSVILAQIRVYAERAAVIEGLGWIEAFARGWQVLKENLGPTIVLWLIFLLIGIGFATIIIGGLLVAALPFMALSALMIGSIQQGPWLAIPIFLGGLVIAAIIALFGSVVETFSSATWTLAYRELAGLVAPAAADPEVELAAE